jgi:putative transposase
LDTTTEAVSKKLFSLWPYDKNRGAIRLGITYDPLWELPDHVVISDGKMGDVSHGKTIRLRKNFTYIMDRGFVDYGWYVDIVKKGAYVIVRMPKHLHTRITSRVRLHTDGMIRDNTIKLGSQKDQYEIGDYDLRMVTFWDNKREYQIRLLTNRWDLPAEEIRELYRRRWDIEVFFKFIKQNLHVKKFYGTTRNAVLIQLYSALISYLLLYLFKPFEYSMRVFLRTIRFSLFLPARSLHLFDSS